MINEDMLYCNDSLKTLVSSQKRFLEIQMSMSCVLTEPQLGVPSTQHVIIAIIKLAYLCYATPPRCFHLGYHSFKGSSTTPGRIQVIPSYVKCSLITPILFAAPSTTVKMDISVMTLRILNFFYIVITAVAYVLPSYPVRRVGIFASTTQLHYNVIYLYYYVSFLLLLHPEDKVIYYYYYYI